MFLDNFKEKIFSWFNARVEKTSSKWWLSIIAFTESSFFPIPPDPFLVAILLVKPHRWVYYSLLVATFSTLGALAGYLVGFAFYEVAGKPLVDFYNLHNELEIVTSLFDNNTFLTMFVAAFTPIPFKLFTIAAGLFKVNIVVFILASFIGRTLRFLIVGFVMKMFGKRILHIIVKYFNLLTIITLFIITTYLLFHYL